MAVREIEAKSFLTDSEKMIDQVIAKGIEAGVDFVIFGGMTLKTGAQSRHFIEVIDKNFPGYKEKI